METTFEILTSLIDKWNRQADKLQGKARREENDMIADRMFSESQCLSACADELKRILAQKGK